MRTLQYKKSDSFSITMLAEIHMKVVMFVYRQNDNNNMITSISIQLTEPVISEMIACSYTNCYDDKYSITKCHRVTNFISCIFHRTKCLPFPSLSGII